MSAINTYNTITIYKQLLSKIYDVLACIALLLLIKAIILIFIISLFHSNNCL